MINFDPWSFVFQGMIVPDKLEVEENPHQPYHEQVDQPQMAVFFHATFISDDPCHGFQEKAFQVFSDGVT